MLDKNLLDGCATEITIFVNKLHLISCLFTKKFYDLIKLKNRLYGEILNFLTSNYF